ncbi:MAG: hypothetical protein JO013_02275 [Alphaproteobacteria bacterium]|nr:hypothetical protein [Alphaproteobacteria bacterium]
MSIDWYLLWPFLAALLVPLALIATRHELRRVRLRLVEELRENLFKDEAELPQLKLVAARYSASEDSSGDTRQSLVLVWTGAIFYFAASFVGFTLLLVPAAWLISQAPQFPRITFALLWAPVASTEVHDLQRTAALLGVAFLGGYVFQLRYLVRATLNQELGALAFARATLQLVQGMIVAVVAYRVGVAVKPSFGGSSDIGFAAELGLGFIIGMYPDVGLARIAKAVRVRIKAVDEEALKASKLVPLEIIEGIDSETAFRLQESNLFDVQNLAAINPIELYAETPFTLFEVFDWVLQAQLCTNVGTSAFAALNRHRIRTIFDLERAVLARGAPDSYVAAIGNVLFVNADGPFRASLGLPPMAPASDGAAPPPPEGAIGISPDIVRHAVAVITDDLHVHRLRALWRTMIRTTGSASADGGPIWLFDTGPLPGDPPET